MSVPQVRDIKTREDIFSNLNMRLAHNRRVQLADAASPRILHKLLLNLAAKNLLAFTSFDDRMSLEDYRSGLLNIAAAAIAAIEIDVKEQADGLTGIEQLAGGLTAEQVETGIVNLHADKLAATKEEDDAQVKGFKGEATYTVD